MWTHFSLLLSLPNGISPAIRAKEWSFEKLFGLSFPKNSWGWSTDASHKGLRVDNRTVS